LGRHASSERVGRGLGWPGWFEAFSAFAIVLPLLFAPQLSSAAPALTITFTLIYAWARRRDALQVMLQRWPLLLIVAYALASVVWSDYPALTLKYALELSTTIAGGLLLSASRRPGDMLLGASAAFGSFLAVSLLFGHSVTVSQASLANDLGTAFTGLNKGKNVLGMTAAMGAVLSLFVFARSIRIHSPLGIVLSLGMLALEVYLTYLARSAGATIALVLSTLTFGVIASLAAIPRQRRAAVCGGLVISLIACGMIAYSFANSVTATVLNLFHKDPTLTGRTYLWYRAWEFIRERPLLGRGFEAFWVQGNLDAEGLWQYAQIPERAGFNFHNTLIELLIHFGWLGGALVAGVFLIGCVRLLRRAGLEPSLVAALYVSLLVFHVSRMPFESLTPSQEDFSTLFMAVALGYGFGPYRPQAAPADLPVRGRRRMIRVREGFPATAAGRRSVSRQPRRRLAGS